MACPCGPVQRVPHAARRQHINTCDVWDKPLFTVMVVSCRAQLSQGGLNGVHACNRPIRYRPIRSQRPALGGGRILAEPLSAQADKKGPSGLFSSAFGGRNPPFARFRVRLVSEGPQSSSACGPFLHPWGSLLRSGILMELTWRNEW
jgi:hypothetical protein